MLERVSDFPDSYATSNTEQAVMSDSLTNDSLEQVFLMRQSKDLQSSLKLARELTGLNRTQ